MSKYSYLETLPKNITMKIIYLFTIAMCFNALCFSQGVPEGMKYQALARDTRGVILSNEPIVLEISLLSNMKEKSKVHYSETHAVTTSALGLFDLVIGAGSTGKGIFNNVPWSTDDIWMQVRIKEKGSADFTTVSNSKLLAVPYAFHAATASQLSGNINTTTGAVASANTPGSPASPWMTFGNVGTNPGIDKLGTTDVKDLVIITSNIERLRILANGDINFKNNLSIDKDLLVKGNVNLNTVYGGTVNNGPLTVRQATSLEKTLTVTGATVLNSTLLADKAAVFNQSVLLSNATLGSTSPSTGALVVNGGVGIGQNLNVAGAANFGGATSFGGKLLVTDASSSNNTTTGAAVVNGGVGIGKELNVGGATNLGSSLAVVGASSLGNTLQVTGATKLLNTLVVDEATTLQKELTVNGLAVFNDSVVMNNDLSTKGLTVSNSNSSYLAVLENTNGSTGDGLKIKLGKTHPMWNNGSYVSVPNIAADAFQGPINTIRGWVIDHNPVQASDLINLFPASLVAGTVANIVNTVTSKINNELGLPISIGPYGIPAIEIVPEIDGVGGPWGFPATNVIPQLTVFPRIPAIPSGNLPTLSVPNLSFSNVSNSLTKENEFISFVDKDNRQLGSIRAQSINDFGADYLDGVYFVNLMASLVGIDIVGGIAGGIAQFTNLAAAYNGIGVEYSSGHGDYAEWLERSNLTEVISSGDIVAVKGGKITKDLTNAEQVMVVSYHPIILGNTPPEGKENEGNKVAFMGQVPVKIMGSVKAGDYIVADTKIPGYGMAITPSKMTVSNYKLAVGRSWETNLNEGPKLVNTLISSNNKPILEILSKEEKNIDRIDSKLSSLEDRLNLYLLRINSKIKISTLN